MYIAFAKAEISLNLYSPLVYIEYKFVANAKYPIMSVVKLLNS